MVEYYAATEGVGTMVDSPTWLAHPGTVGRPMLPELVKVADEDGTALAAGEVGLVFLRTQAATRFDYYGDADKTADAYRGTTSPSATWATWTTRATSYLTDRSANLIISGGVNIYPAEIDAILLQHPAVGDVATIGVPDEEWGEAVKAVVQLADGVEPSARVGLRAAGASVATGWPTSSARARSTSPLSCRARIRGRSTSGSCASSIVRQPCHDVQPQ